MTKELNYRFIVGEHDCSSVSPVLLLQGCKEGHTGFLMTFSLPKGFGEEVMRGRQRILHPQQDDFFRLELFLNTVFMGLEVDITDSDFVISSIDEISIESDVVRLSGKCYQRGK